MWSPVSATSHTSLKLMPCLKFSTSIHKCIFRNTSVFWTYLWRDVQGEITITVFAQIRVAKKDQQLEQSQTDCAWLFRIYIEVCHMVTEASQTALVTQPTRVRLSCRSSWLQCPTGSQELAASSPLWVTQKPCDWPTIELLLLLPLWLKINPL